MCQGTSLGGFTGNAKSVPATTDTVQKRPVAYRTGDAVWFSRKGAVALSEGYEGGEKSAVAESTQQSEVPKRLRDRRNLVGQARLGAFLTPAIWSGTPEASHGSLCSPRSSRF